MKAVVIASGGLDSTTLIYYLQQQGYELELLSFDYGQKHRKELEFAKWHADTLSIPWQRVDLSNILPLLKGSALTDAIQVPHGHYQEETMRITVVPNRNAIMLSIAWGFACSIGADIVAFGAHAGDHFIYPDCRQEFIDKLNAALQVGTDHVNLKLYAPFINKTKGQIVTIGAGLNVPYLHTWTCYEGKELHCGKCGACVERKEAFVSAGLPDPTEYRHA
jgi:7-cyano-7-deazaguanine synthase